MKEAVFTGSFDPITFGHLDILKKALTAVDKIHVIVGLKPGKSEMFTPEERISLIKKSIKEFDLDPSRFQIGSWTGLVTDYCKEHDIALLIRGLRQVGDFDYEASMSKYNSELAPGVETLFFISSPEYRHISSSGVKEVARFKGELSHYLTPTVIKSIENKY